MLERAATASSIVAGSGSPRLQPGRPPRRRRRACHRPPPARPVRPARWVLRCCRKGTRRMIVIATIGATMTMPIAPRLPVLSAITAEPAMTRTQTSEPTINHAVDEADVAGAPAQLEHAVSQPQERPLLHTRLPAHTQPQAQVPVAVGAVGRSAVLRQDPAAVESQAQMTAGDQGIA